MFYHLMYYLIFLKYTLTPLSIQEETVRLQVSIEESFEQEKYDEVIDLYDSLKLKTPLIAPALLLTVAQAAQHRKDTAIAKPIYRQLSELGLSGISTIALNQLGVQAYQDKSYQSALAFFKKAINLAPNYTKAQYNYELVYKKHPPRSRNTLAENKTIEEEFEQQAKVTDQDNEKKDLLSQTIPPRMERERALQLLDAMRANELQGTSLRQRGGSGIKSERNW
ncbi:MAG: tetratricopeptide (TPR) repeat protein [Spirosomataceae bacterium]